MAADPKLQAIVERMVAANEPEENIAAVIQHYKSQMPSIPAPTTGGSGVLNTLASLAGTVDENLGKFKEGSKGIAKGAAHSAIDLAEGAAQSHIIPGLTTGTLPPELTQLARQKIAYSNTPQRIGGGIETAAEIALPLVRGVGMVPTTTRAGRTFQTVMSAAKDVPLDVAGPGNAALEIQQLGSRGGTTPRAVTQFMRRITDPAQSPMTYQEGRDWASNISRLSADEYNRLTPVIKKAMGNFRTELSGSLRGAADTVGQGEAYQNAMKEYAQAKQIQDVLSTVGHGIQRGLPYASGAGLGYLLAQKLSGLLGDK